MVVLHIIVSQALSNWSCPLLLRSFSTCKLSKSAALSNNWKECSKPSLGVIFNLKLFLLARDPFGVHCKGPAGPNFQPEKAKIFIKAKISRQPARQTARQPDRQTKIMPRTFFVKFVIQWYPICGVYLQPFGRDWQINRQTDPQTDRRTGILFRRAICRYLRPRASPSGEIITFDALTHVKESLYSLSDTKHNLNIKFCIFIFPFQMSVA